MSLLKDLAENDSKGLRDIMTLDGLLKGTPEKSLKEFAKRYLLVAEERRQARVKALEEADEDLIREVLEKRGFKLESIDEDCDNSCGCCDCER